MQGRSVGPNVSGVADYAATNGDAGAIWIVFFRPYFADHFGMADLLFLVGRDIVVIDDEERVGSGHLFGAWIGALPNALAETA